VYNEQPNTPLLSAGLQQVLSGPAAATLAAAAYLARTVSRTCSTVAVALAAAPAARVPASQPQASAVSQQLALSSG
jgi:hypothetical protein